MRVGAAALRRSARNEELMRSVGLVTLILGFAWIAYDCFGGFTAFQHTNWIMSAKELPEGTDMPRDEAIMAIRKTSLRLKDRHRVVLIPAGLMLAGGLMLAMGGPSGAAGMKNAEQAGASDGEGALN